MNWLNLNVQILDSENFIGSDPTDRATWLCLLRYCIGQENMGTIPDCAEWADRKWQQLVRITKKEAGRKCDLWSWDGNTLIVWGYPVEKEQEVQEKRERARTNGAKGGRPKLTDTGTHEKPTLVNSAKAEEKGKEGEGNIPPYPQGGDGQGGISGEVKPKKSRPGKGMTQAEKRRTTCPELTPAMQRIGSWFGRQADTPWSLYEREALQTVSPTDNQITGMEFYYTAALEKDDDYRRRDVATLLNNWHGELDRARAFYRANPPK
jgi:hypothetical protein